jgi:hypothetical protein
LLGYSLLSFFIPFINISPLLEKNEVTANGIVQFIPSVQLYTATQEESSQCLLPFWSTNYDNWDWMALGIMTGVGILLIRFVIRLISFQRMKNMAKLISADGMQLYQVNENIIPFSFGKAVFINSKLHSEAELQEIIRHEFVHVRQKHTVDIVWGELLCILNWYNPFAWLIKKAIRQNLEFIADDKALENGINKKQYQYLLLKVIGNNHFSIAQKFNFSSLKKRMAMMNKLKTARIHLLRFLFILPLLAVILISFRQNKGDTIPREKNKNNFLSATDTIPGELNDKGYIIDVIGKKSNAMVIVKDKDNKVVERIPFSKWKENEKFYEDTYGKFPPPLPPDPPAPPKPIELPANVKRLDVKDKKATVELKEGKVEKYDLGKPEEKAAFEKKYGDVIPPPPLPPDAPTPVELPANVKRLDVNDNKATVVLKDGKVEKYDLNKPEEKAAFEKKYGEVIPPVQGTPVEEGVRITGDFGVSAKVDGVSVAVAPIKTEAAMSVIASMKVPTLKPGTVTFLDDNGNLTHAEEEILLTITKKTTRQQLDDFIDKMKEKGIELKFDNIDYDNDKLVHISGSAKFKNSNNSFSVTDFNKVVLSRVKDNDRIYLKVDVIERQVI